MDKMGKPDGPKHPNQGRKKHGNYQVDKTKISIDELKGNYFKVANPDAYNKTIKAVMNMSK